MSAFGGSPGVCPRRRRSPPGCRRGASAERRDVTGSYERRDCSRDAGSPALSCSRASLSSNKDSGYVPSPAGAVQFELEAADGEEAAPPPPPPAAARPATRPIAIPGARLPPPEASGLLRRRRRLLRCEDSEEEEEDGARVVWQEQGAGGDWEDGGRDRGAEDSVEGDEERAGGDWPDGGRDRGGEEQRGQAAGQLALVRAETRSLQVGWRDGAVIPSRFSFRADLPAVFAGAEPVPAAAVRPRRRPPAARAHSVGTSVETDVGQELREIADSLPLSRSAPGALVPRRDIWAMIRRTFDFGINRQAAPRDRRDRSGP